MSKAANLMSETTTYKGGNTAKTTQDCNLAYSVNQIETAQYIADMVLELRNMAKSAALYAAMVPLEYAYYEAFSVANRVSVPKHEVERLNHIGDDAKRAGSSAA
jgi:hypothetical protein